MLHRAKYGLGNTNGAVSGISGKKKTATQCVTVSICTDYSTMYGFNTDKISSILSSA